MVEGGMKSYRYTLAVSVFVYRANAPTGPLSATANLEIPFPPNVSIKVMLVPPKNLLPITGCENVLA
jgi:hypothetical protein